MRPQTKELLELIKRSKGKNKLGIDHLRSLIDDVRELGAENLILEAERVFVSKSRRHTAPANPLISSLEGLQIKAGLDRKKFLGYVVDEVHREDSALKRPPKKQHTLPGIVNYYIPHLGADKLEAIAVNVVRLHSQTH